MEKFIINYNGNGNDLEIEFKLRAFLIYENILSNLENKNNSLNNSVYLFYSFILANTDTTFEEFLNYIDTQENFDILEKFGKWLNYHQNKGTKKKKI